MATEPVGYRCGWNVAAAGTLYVAVAGRIISEITVEAGATYSTRKKQQTIIKLVSKEEWDDLEDFIERVKNRATVPTKAKGSTVNTKKVETAATPLDTLWRDVAATSRPVGAATPTKQTRQTGPALVDPLPTRKGGIWSWDEIKAARAAMRR